MKSVTLHSSPLAVILGTLCILYGYGNAEVRFTAYQHVTEYHGIVTRHPEFLVTCICSSRPALYSSFIIFEVDIKN